MNYIDENLEMHFGKNVNVYLELLNLSLCKLSGFAHRAANITLNKIEI